ncbi:hypothetical protein [Marinagarivorans cellulosilyticus]|uniref:LVIVD repeat-containing protein n=1 Tax=Marinagarivorans cellulosilyticus TaxID=2721545 RepID=A0AAN1WEN5_9GAMM|nr:hypothetical protein [Marinagarivorans cellulosilyticus]BCD96218.1 hypothetical protein MARGE09_P0417 [Marinagarivorans cellulosilyticus]
MKKLKALRPFIPLCTALFLGACTGASESPNGSAGQSNAGSTATMLPYGNVAYVLDNNLLKIIDLEAVPPVLEQAISLDAPETLYISNDYLYIGGENGVDIFNLEDPVNPVKASTYEHMRACDPIIVDDDIGYVTLRSGFSDRCRLAGPNRLEIVDMSDPELPELINTFTMTNPYGLAKTDTHLAVCEEAFGLTLLNVDDPLAVSETVSYSDINCFDLIYNDGVLIATASDGIYQFSATSQFLELLSAIPVGDAVEPAIEEMN